MKVNIGTIAAFAVTAGFFVLLGMCVALWGSDPRDSTKLMVSTSLLASMLSLFVLAYAALAHRNAESPSERYRVRYRRKDGTDGKGRERK